MILALRFWPFPTHDLRAFKLPLPQALDRSLFAKACGLSVPVALLPDGTGIFSISVFAAGVHRHVRACVALPDPDALPFSWRPTALYNDHPVFGPGPSTRTHDAKALNQRLRPQRGTL